MEYLIANLTMYNHAFDFYTNNNELKNVLKLILISGIKNVDDYDILLKFDEWLLEYNEETDIIFLIMLSNTVLNFYENSTIRI